jgi:hypothetical protein
MDDASVKGSSYETKDCESADYPCGGVEEGIKGIRTVLNKATPHFPGDKPAGVRWANKGLLQRSEFSASKITMDGFTKHPLTRDGSFVDHSKYYRSASSDEQGDQIFGTSSFFQRIPYSLNHAIEYGW